MEIDIGAECRRVILEESAALADLAQGLPEDLVAAVSRIHASTGKVIAMGIGKSGIVARKIAATFSSLGTPALFVHPAEALHGDLGSVSAGDVVLAVSNSGETPEFRPLLPALARLGATIIALVGRKDSTLARAADLAIVCPVEREACALNLAPTSSAVVMTAVGDAMAVALSRLRLFTPEHFAMLHPGGTLGRRLTFLVRDVWHTGDKNPVVGEDASLMEVLEAITAGGLGAVCVADADGKLRGIVTDGDMRRGLKRGGAVFECRARDLMTGDPVTASPDDLATEALAAMENRPSQIAVLPVVDAKGRPAGMVRLHDIVRAGI